MSTMGYITYGCTHGPMQRCVGEYVRFDLRAYVRSWTVTFYAVCVCIAIVHISTVLIFAICYIQSFMVGCKTAKGCQIT